MCNRTKSKRESYCLKKIHKTQLTSTIEVYSYFKKLSTKHLIFIDDIFSFINNSFIVSTSTIIFCIPHDITTVVLYMTKLLMVAQNMIIMLDGELHDG